MNGVFSNSAWRRADVSVSMLARPAGTFALPAAGSSPRAPDANANAAPSNDIITIPARRMGRLFTTSACD